MQLTSLSDTKQAKPEAERSMEDSARLLAGDHAQVEEKAPSKRILLSKHLPVWKQTLADAYQYFRATSARDLVFSRAGEWMLDNYYIVEQTFHLIEEDLPKGYFDELPKLETTQLNGYPRIFAVAWEFTKYRQGQLDLPQLITFMEEYQRVTPLLIGELWALPTMLRISVLEHLAVAVTAITGKNPPDILKAQMILPPPPAVTEEATVANCFISLKLLSTTDWKAFFERTSRVEQILNGDPAGIFEQMDFETRDKYRRVIEEISRHSNCDEENVAQLVIEFANRAQTTIPSSDKNYLRKSHVGFYLIDKGRLDLELEVDYRPGPNARLRRWGLAHPTGTYLGSIGSLSLLVTAGLLLYAYLTGGSWIQLIIVGFLGVGISMEAATNLVNWAVTNTFPPRTLPRMDFSEGIPKEFRTMVVIPTLLENEVEFGLLLEALELHYLSNPDPQLSFALLMDFPDAKEQQTSADEQLLARAIAGIERLNRKYENTSLFYLFNRKRQWNPSEGAWMGWERKRGKLREFNHLIMGSETTSYTTQVGDLSILPEVKYVITLDVDTSLPQGSARRLVATLAHPLNRAIFSDDERSITAGYSILQPRIEIKPTSANRSIFAKVYSGKSGIDLYTLAVSDVYQDLFGEGIYVGKGIYDVRAFEKSLTGQVQENTLLSHDLYEGLYGRAGLVTDIILYEDYPARYLVHARRLRRWIRGDWQLLPWLFPKMPSQPGHVPNRLSAIDRWKIFDNLRRSLLAPIMLVFFVCAWLILPGSPLFWTLVLLFTPAVTITAHTINDAAKSLQSLSLQSLFNALRYPVIRWALTILFLPYEAFLASDAIGITIVRLFITRKHLLQWTTAAHFAISFKKTLLENWLEMAITLVFNTLLGIIVFLYNLTAFPVAVPILIAWVLAPQIAYRLSRPLVLTPAPLPEIQRQRIRRLARRTWAYFDKFTGPEDHWLPPDHFQEKPGGMIGHYTTPTNIGLFLLSALSAYDLGYIAMFELAVRLRNTFENMDKLEHYRGHLLNWYDTRTLVPLPPRYISTVDSGNLAACLIALKQGCVGLRKDPIVGGVEWQGLVDLLGILDEILKELEVQHPSSAFSSFEVELDNIRQRVLSSESNPWNWTEALIWLSNQGWYRISQHLMNLLSGLSAGSDQEILGELQLYLDAFHQQLISMQRNLKVLVPWFGRIDRPPRLFAQASNGIQISWRNFLNSIPPGIPSLEQAAAVYDHIQASLNLLEAALKEKPGQAKLLKEAQEWCRRLSNDLTSARFRAETLLIGFDDLAREANTIAYEMDFRFLYDEQRRVFHIGYNATTEKWDTSYYDLLASEARIASLIAIAKGDVSPRHWLYLARPVTRVNGNEVLLSWSGTMFEYLMPSIFCRNYPGTFLSDSCFTAISTQINYCRQKHIPWGISESGFYSFDAAMNYQYRAFGVPDLGYKRDLPDDAVVSPYASIMGLSLQPHAVVENLTHLEDYHMLGRYGLYEAIDFTPSRMASQQEYALVQSYMSHHQGMILLSVCNYLADELIVRRFHSEERIKSVELLLQEKIPENPTIEYPHPDTPSGMRFAPRLAAAAPWRVPADSPTPQVHFFGDGGYGLMITSAGGGYSQWEEFALTRWRSDTTLDDWGTWIYIQDRENGVIWSATTQPVRINPGEQEVQFYPHKAEFRRWDHGISLHTEVTVGKEDIEIRRVTIHNDSDASRRLKLISYAEVVMASQDVDQRHQAFNKLFIESEYLHENNALLFHRRPRSSDEKPLWLAHTLVVEEGHKISREFETDRTKFIGRGHTLRSPIALEGKNSHLSGTAGATLDPIMSLAQEITLKPHTRSQIAFLTLAGSTREEVLERISRYQSHSVINREFDEARIRSEEELAGLELPSASLVSVQQILSALLYPAAALRAAPDRLEKNSKGQSALWGYGISGDFPIFLIHVSDSDNPLLLDSLQSFMYWRNRKIKINLVILNDQDTGYAMDLHNQVLHQIVHLGADVWLNQREGIFLLRTDQIPEADMILLETFANVVLDPQKGSFAEQARQLTTAPTRLPDFTAAISPAGDPEPTPSVNRPTGLQFDNGLGGFTPDGKEFVIFLSAKQNTPRPWANVIANPKFGFLVSESGSGYTWAINSGENRLTPFQNDPLLDRPGEAIYLRDEETGLLWSPTPLPAGADTSTIVRHGAGYSIFESQSHGLLQHLRLFADVDSPVKIIQLRLKNIWSRPRRITVTYFAEWVLGTNRSGYQTFVVPEFDSARHALLAKDTYNSEFGTRVAFLAANKKPHGLTADRTEFLGRMGSFRTPGALGRIGLSSNVQAGQDPCAAIQLHVDLEPGQEEEVFFLLGEGQDREESLAVISKLQEPGEVETAWKAVNHQWEALLSQITVHTPDAAMDLMLNRWLLYQTISCRLWGRSALYQSSGAFGFRDQLQDVLAVLHSDPSLARDHILRAATHQFEEGDVLHWWHPPSGRGVRTRISDDMLWLPYVTWEYISITNDKSILNEEIPFLKGDPLKPTETERYNLYEFTEAAYPLYEHCRRALEKGSTQGPHGLPLMGTGDWNDGMNKVGVQGQGESVWLGWFLYATLNRFVPLCEMMNENSAQYRRRAENLVRALEANAWDGDWYLRAYYDDGSRLGTKMDGECNIDSIAQSWSVLSNAANPRRAANAMKSVYQLLVREDDRLVLLLEPPFDKTRRDPGYIKGYPPGIRENGGQYTHAAVWVAWAFAKLGQGDQAEELFRLLNPIYHADTAEKVARYKVEPYSQAADVYSTSPYVGMGGWTGYTGSAAWMYRLGMEAILGISKEGDELVIDPCIPAGWKEYSLTYHFGETNYQIEVKNPEGVNRGASQVCLDGKPLPDHRIHLVNDQQIHQVQLLLGTKIA